MTTYYVSEAGTNGVGTSWATAKTTLAGALTLASVSGDVILVDKDHTGDNALAADTAWTILNNISIICVDKDSSDALASMGTATWIGSSTASRTLSLAGAYTVRIYGLTFRIAGGTSFFMSICTTDGGHFILDSCYLWYGTTGTSGRIYFGPTPQANTYVEVNNTTIRLGSTSHSIVPQTGTVFRNCTISPDGSSPSSLVTSVRSGITKFIDCDLSHCGSNAIIGSHSTTSSARYELYRCKLGANYVALSAQTPANLGAASVLLLDCSSGDTHGIMHYVDALGSIVSDSGIYFTAGAAAQSWKITTTANCSHATPFVTPWVSVYNSGTSAITPYLEILRDGSATAYQDDEIGGEFSAKTTIGTTLGTLYTDFMPLLGTPADQAAGAGLSSWTGESGTAWSGKIDSGAAITPAEVGEIIGRAVVGEPSITAYLNPQILW